MAPAARSYAGAGATAAVAASVVGIGGAMGTAAASAVGIGGAATPVSVPFVAPTATSPRLPLIIGDPPFHCKGAEKGKKGKNGAPDKPDKEALDPVEFERQLTGQQEGINNLSVAAFIANRDQYIKTSKDNKGKNNKNGGRDIKEGNPAQKLARKKAFKAKFDELRQQDPSLTEEQIIIDTNKWLENQTALHDPDQVAGGYATNITGMGDERINSSIGGAWPWRIKKIDKQIRAYAKKMTPEEQRTTYLNISLPFTKPVA